MDVFAQHPHCLPAAPRMRVAVVVVEEVVHVLNKLALPYQGSPCQCYCQELHLSIAENNSEYLIWHHSRG